MDYRKRPPNWPEHMEWIGSKEPEETRGDRIRGNIAAVVLGTLVLGSAFAAFPYAAAFYEIYTTDSHHRYDIDNTDLNRRVDFWIKGDTKKAGWYRFAAGAVLGAAIAGGWLLWLQYKQDQNQRPINSDGIDPFANDPDNL